MWLPMTGCEYDADEQEEQHGAEAHGRIMLKECKHFRIALQVRDIVTDHVQTHKHERETYEEFAY